jgi:hypothetical protein
MSLDKTFVIQDISLCPVHCELMFWIPIQLINASGPRLRDIFWSARSRSTPATGPGMRIHGPAATLTVDRRRRRGNLRSLGRDVKNSPKGSMEIVYLSLNGIFKSQQGVLSALRQRRATHSDSQCQPLSLVPTVMRRGRACTALRCAGGKSCAA